jgi:hypothetical protein
MGLDVNEPATMKLTIGTICGSAESSVKQIHGAFRIKR